MINRITYLVIIFTISSCTTNSVYNDFPFKNKNVAALIKNSIEELHDIDMKQVYDEIYVLQKNDSLFVLNVDYSNTPNFLLYFSEYHCFKYKKYKVTVINDKKSEYSSSLLETNDSALCEKNNIPFGPATGSNIINGIVFKVKEEDNQIAFSEIMKGNIYSFFKNNTSYQIKKVPMEEPGG